jgi:hypothetical protein
VRSVPGFTNTLVATSSDGSLPDPRTDGAVFLDTAIHALAYDSSFAATELNLNEVSQLLWGSYGCSNHTAAGKAGLVCASAVANYYLTRHIYWVGPDGVYRYHCRRPPGTDTTTRDHRIELVTAGDLRAALRAQAPRLADAPGYLIICIATTGDWPELEVGFAGMGALLEASSMDLQGDVTSALTAAEQGAIRQVTGIPTADLPRAVVSLGHASDISSAEPARQIDEGVSLSVENLATPGRDVAIRYELPAAAVVQLAVYDCLGHEVRMLVAGKEGKGTHAATWNARDDRGRAVPSGIYFCRLKAGGVSKGDLIAVVR